MNERDGRETSRSRKVGLALRELVASRPVRAVRALVMRAVDARDTLLAPIAPILERTRARSSVETPVERVRGLEAPVTIARDAYGVPGIFAASRADLAFGMGWACAEDRLFQMELSRRALRGELCKTFGDRPVDDQTTGRIFAGRTFFDLDLFVRAMDFRGAAEASHAIASSEARAWVDAYAAGINAYVASGRRPLEMLLLDLEPTPWTGADAFLVAKGVAFQLSFSYRFALAWALVANAVDGAKAAALRSIAHPLGITRGDVGAIEPLVATTEVLRAVLGAEGVHLGSNAFAVAPSRSILGRPILASDPHMPLGAPGTFWEVRLRGADIDARGVAIPGFPGLPIGQNAHAAWGVTAGWGDDAQLYREDLGRLRRARQLHLRSTTIEIHGGGSRSVDLLSSPRGPIISPALGRELIEGATDSALALRWAGREATLDADAALKLLVARTFDDLRGAVRDHGGPTLNFVWADDAGHVGWHYAGKIPRRAGDLDADDRAPGDRSARISGLEIADGDDPRAQFVGCVPPDELPWVLDPEDGIVVSANTRPHGPGYRHALGELFEPPFRKARIRALIDRHRTIGPREAAAIQRDVRSSWALQIRDALLAGLDDETLDLAPRRGRDLIRLVRTWDGEAREDSAGAAATYVFLDAVIRHVFLEDLGELAFDRFFDLLNTAPLVLLQIFGDDRSPWFAGVDRATVVRDAAAMAEGRLRRMRGDDPSAWRWGDLHLVTFRHAFVDVPGLRAASSPGPFPGRGDGTTVCMGEYALRGGGFAVRVAPAFRTVMIAGAPHDARSVLPPGQSGDPASKHYRDQIAPYLAGELRETAWDETDFSGRRLKLVP
jgi:penicillin amidase